MPFLTTAEAAERLNVTQEYIRDLVAAGRLVAYRLGDRGQLRFKPEDVASALRIARPSTTNQPTSAGI